MMEGGGGRSHAHLNSPSHVEPRVCTCKDTSRYVEPWQGLRCVCTRVSLHKAVHYWATTRSVLVMVALHKSGGIGVYASRAG